jgi:cytochrome c oxidase cbb3-type subunit 1
MVSFGAIYYILPRATGLAWPSETLARAHFNFSAGGLLLYVAALLLGGLVQGMKLNNASVEIVAAIRSTIPFQGLATLGLMLFLAGQVAFLTNLQRLAWKVWEPMLKAICPFEAAKQQQQQQQQQVKAGVKP